MLDITLLYIRSEAIVEFISEHPVKWYSLQSAKRGDILTPTPAVSVFFDLLRKKGELFTQEEYIEECRREWPEWFEEHKEIEEYLEARLGRNFYPSCIDSLHFFSLAVESGYFDKCLLNTVVDAVGKVDLVLFSKKWSEPVNVALQVGTKEAERRRIYKDTFRKKTPVKVYTVVLPVSRPRRPGNKRWYKLEDVLQLIKQVEQNQQESKRWPTVQSL